MKGRDCRIDDWAGYQGEPGCPPACWRHVGGSADYGLSGSEKVSTRLSQSDGTSVRRLCGMDRRRGASARDKMPRGGARGVERAREPRARGETERNIENKLGA